VSGHLYNYPPPDAPTPYLTVQFIEFTHCNDRFVAETLDRKTTKYQLLINNTTIRGWNVAPLVVLVAIAKATTHIPSVKFLETNLKFLAPREIIPSYILHTRAFGTYLLGGLFTLQKRL
jgi:hypothetical protein